MQKKHAEQCVSTIKNQKKVGKHWYESTDNAYTMHIGFMTHLFKILHTV